MKKELLKRKGGRSISLLFLRMFSLLALLVVGMSASWATDYTTVANFKHLESEFQTSGTDQLLSGNGCDMVKFSWSGIENTTETVGGNKYYKFTDNNSYVKVKFYHQYNPNAPFVAGDIVRVHLMVTNADVDPGFILKSDKGTPNKTVLGEKQSANTDITVSYILTENDINSDGSISIYRTGGGYATRYYSFEVAMKRYNHDVVMNQTTDGTATFQVTSGTASCALNTPVSRASVSDGATIKLINTPNTDILFWGWQVKDGSTWTDSWNIAGFSSESYAITQTTEIRPKFTSGIKLEVYSNNGTYGNVKIQHDGHDASQTRVTPYPGEVKFVATPTVSGQFVGWYSDYECKNQVSTNPTLVYNANGETDDIFKTTGTISRWAKFEAAAPTFDPAIDLTAMPDGHGSNVVSLVNGTLTVKGGNDNWVLAKAMGDNLNQETEKYTGVQLTTNGDAWRIIVKYKDNNDEVKEVTKNVDAASANTTIYYSWSMIGVPYDSRYKITEVRFSGKQDWSLSESKTSSVTITNASLVKVTENSSMYVTKGTDDVKFNLDKHANFYDGAAIHHGDCEWTFKDVQGADNYATFKSASTSNNMMQVFNFDGYAAKDYSGVTVESKGEHFRIIAYTSSGSFVKNVGATGSRTLTHVNWEDFTPAMTDADVEAINKVSIAGCSNHSTEESVDIYSVRLDKMYRYVVETIADRGETFNAGTLAYHVNVDGKDVKVELHNANGNSRDNSECGGIKLNRSTTENSQLFVGVPHGYKITKMKVGFGSDTQTYSVSFNRGDGLDEGNDGVAEYTNTLTDKTAENYNDGGVIMKIRGEGTQGEGYDVTELHITYVTFDLEYFGIDESRKVTTNGAERDYWLYVPEYVTTNATETFPVVFSLHGTSNDYIPTGGGVQNFNSLADTEHFIVVYPRGNMRKFPGFDGGANDIRGWDSDGENNADIQYFKDIIKALKENTDGFKINEKKIYITGFSNGGMMTYSAANAAADVFAAFASISGFPLNEFHLRHHGARPVPFMHIHGTKDDFVKYVHMPTIVDNMTQRNGCYPVPDVTSGDASVYGNATRYTKSVYSSSDLNAPYIYYEIGTGISASDTGMGHNDGCVIGGVDSKKVIWDFLKGYELPTTFPTVEFRPGIEAYLANSASYNPEEHGWSVGWKKEDGNIVLNKQTLLLAQYGETKSSQNNSQYVYHTLQLKGGDHNITFNAANSNSSEGVKVQLKKIANIQYVNDHDVITECDEDIINKLYYVGDVKINFTTEGAGEYILTISKEKAEDATQLSNLTISSGKVSKESDVKKETEKTDFAGYFDYQNRLIAQWNFDLCDGNRFNVDAIKQHGQDYWSVDYSNTDAGADGNPKFGTIIVSYKQALNGQELTYDGPSNNHLIPIAAGLKFYAEPNQVKILVTVKNGEITGTQLSIDTGDESHRVRMEIPYVVNSFRADDDDDTAADKPNGGDFRKARFEAYKDCLHHIKRDIVYFAPVNKNVWDTFTNKCFEDNDGDGVKTDNEKTLFNSGGFDHVEGKDFYKCNFTGTQGQPCVVTFKQDVVFDRIGVNRNLVYSFYTENVASTTGNARPYPGLRLIGTPRGAKVANVGDTYTDHTNAIAMTYGGWKYNGNEYDKFDGSRATDGWGELTVFGEDQNVEYAADALDYDKMPIATDGFPVYSYENALPVSENVNPSTSSSTYHNSHDGIFFLDQEYKANITPWSLPCRGAYAKFEPTYPGVLNVHILQKGGHDYYIVDEFGSRVKKAFVKTGMKQSVTNSDGKFRIAKDDNVKYTFDVYPGKTYYLFSNTAAMGINGFCFEPYVYTLKDSNGNPKELERYDVGILTLELDQNTNYSVPATGDYEDNKTNPETGNVDFVDYYSTQTAAYRGTNMKDAEGNDIKDAEGNVVKDAATIVPKSKNPDIYMETSKAVDGKIAMTTEAVHVHINRSFNPNKWAAICLPFSMNNLELQTVFGDDVKVVLMRDVQEKGKNGYDKTTANFIYHVNQDIIAGYPYLIYPSKQVWSISANVFLPQTEPEKLRINGVGQNTVAYDGYQYETNGTYNYDGLKCFDFIGNFQKETLPAGSYVIATNGNLTRLAKDQEAKPYRSFLKYVGEQPSTEAKVRIEALSFGGFDDVESSGDVTNIDDVLLQSGIVGSKTNVYSANGALIRENTDNLEGLPKGLYIVNGKKFLVK